MVEGARLESVYRGNSIGGSNPSLSAIPSYRIIASHFGLAFALLPNSGIFRQPLQLELFSLTSSFNSKNKSLQDDRFLSSFQLS